MHAPNKQDQEKEKWYSGSSSILCASHRHATSGKHQHEVNSQAVQELIIYSVLVPSGYFPSLYEVGIFFNAFLIPCEVGIFFNAFLIPCSISINEFNVFTIFFSPLLSATLICEWKIFITSKQVLNKAISPNQNPIPSISNGCTEYYTSVFFSSTGKETACTIPQVQVALFIRCRKIIRTTPTSNIMNLVVPLGHGTIWKKENKETDEKCSFCIQT